MQLPFVTRSVVDSVVAGTVIEFPAQGPRIGVTPGACVNESLWAESAFNAAALAILGSKWDAIARNWLIRA